MSHEALVRRLCGEGGFLVLGGGVSDLRALAGAGWPGEDHDVAPLGGAGAREPTLFVSKVPDGTSER